MILTVWNRQQLKLSTLDLPAWRIRLFTLIFRSHLLHGRNSYFSIDNDEFYLKSLLFLQSRYYRSPEVLLGYQYPLSLAYFMVTLGKVILMIRRWILKEEDFVPGIFWISKSPILLLTSHLLVFIAQPEYQTRIEL